MHAISSASPSHVVVKDPGDGSFDTYDIVAWVLADGGTPLGVILRQGQPVLAVGPQYVYVQGPAL